METKHTDIQISKNAFDLLRYYAAFSVMLLHFTGYARIYTANGLSALSILRSIVLFFPGVVVLFSISGFLITASRERTPDPRLFFRKRILRLYPELWVCTLFHLLVLAILVPDRLDSGIFVWLVTQFFGIANTPDCLKTFATGSVNGALWTIFVELQFYFIILFCYRLLSRLSMVSWSILLALCVCINLLAGHLTPVLPSFAAKLLERSFLPYMLWFFIGVFCYMKKAVLLPFLRKYCLLFSLIYFLLYLSPILKNGYYCSILVSILCPIVTIGLAYLLPSLRIKTDLSYGMFLYHWIVLNLIIYFDLFRKLPWIVCLVIFMISTLLLSWCSTTFVGRAVRSHIAK